MFGYRQVCIEALGYALPEEVVTSEQLEGELAPVYERFGLHVGRLELMTGIRKRRFWAPGTMPSDAATRAGRAALENANLSPGDIDALVFTAVSRDCLEPATASVVHHQLGLPRRAAFFDISNACLGFLNGIVTVANMIELGQIRRGLVVAGESSRPLVRTTIRHLLESPNLTRAELKQAFASLTIGSGAAGAVVCHESVSKSRHRLLGGVSRAASEHNELCRGSGDSGFSADAAMTMRTDAELLLEGGCELAAETWKEFKAHLEWDEFDIGRTYCHQVGSVHRDRLYAALGLDGARDFSTFEFLGNVGSVSLPLTLAMGVERDPPATGTNVALLGIGSGLCCVMLGVRW
ncbi:MAG: 3-oxoacyl-ACP synthase III [Phycisphaerae bacterium]|nr:3-oxoacyl-ACP synthase III [Phycisphaerae bacterium]